MTVDDDRSSDARFMAVFAGLLLVEVVLGFLADAGTISLEVWLVLAVAAILVAGLISAVAQRGR